MRTPVGERLAPRADADKTSPWPPPPGFLSRFTKVAVWRGALPHWNHAGIAALVTIRLGDSLPERLLGPWREDRDDWLREHPQPWDESVVREYDERFRRQIERWLDAGHGSCIFNDAESRRIVEEALRFYDAGRYALYSFVVMPNHLHVLLMPLEGWGLEKILEDFKHYVSHRLGKRKCWEGTFWQSEYWDTMIRNGEHFKKALAYIRGNSLEKSWSVYGGVQNEG